ncbi:hypothetical protein EIP86_008745 [Pleurotus ostreatoroseus]|nr:hypothetical protein EIP86_008745 [Pleurotus ostreatoroseus]
MARLPNNPPSHTNEPPPPARPPTASQADAPHRAPQGAASRRGLQPATTSRTPLLPVLTTAPPNEPGPPDSPSPSPSPLPSGDPADWPLDVLQRVTAYADEEMAARRAAAEIEEAPPPRAASRSVSPVLEWDSADLPPEELARLMDEAESAAVAQQLLPAADIDANESPSPPDNSRPPTPYGGTPLADIPAEDLHLVLASFGQIPPRPATPQIVHEYTHYTEREIQCLMEDAGLMYVAYDNINQWPIPDDNLPSSDPDEDFNVDPPPRESPRTVEEAGAAFLHAFHRSGVVTPAATTPASSPIASRVCTLPAPPTPSSSRMTPPTSPPSASTSTPPTPVPGLPGWRGPFTYHVPEDVYYEDGMPHALRRFRMPPRTTVYVVTRGHYIGIFSDWFLAKDQVSGYSNGSLRGFTNKLAAWEAWARASVDGDTEGLVHCRSLVGMVRLRGANGGLPPYTVE